MHELKRIYTQNLILVLVIFVATIGLPFSKNIAIIKTTIFILYVCCYIFISYLMVSLIKRINLKESSINELIFLYMTLIVVCASGYFLFSVVDTKGTMISGLSEMHNFNTYNFSTFDGVLSFLDNLIFTFINCLYYSIVVMATIGDSSVTLHSVPPRTLVAFEVAMTISLTVFKVGSLYSSQSSGDFLSLKNEIVNEINKSKKPIEHSCLWCTIKRKFIR